MLKTVQERWGLPSLTARDAAAPSLADVLTLAAPRADDVLAGVTVPVAAGTTPAAGTPSHLQEVQADLISRQYAAGQHDAADALPATGSGAAYESYIRAYARPAQVTPARRVSGAGPEPFRPRRRSGGDGNAAGRRGSQMMRACWSCLGVVVALAGVIFTLQGVGAIGGSAMSGVTFWAVAGPVIVVAGHRAGFRRAAPPLRALTWPAERARQPYGRGLLSPAVRIRKVRAGARQIRGFPAEWFHGFRNCKFTVCTCQASVGIYAASSGTLRMADRTWEIGGRGEFRRANS